MFQVYNGPRVQPTIWSVFQPDDIKRKVDIVKLNFPIFTRIETVKEDTRL
jgi:hypothetical protein